MIARKYNQICFWSSFGNGDLFNSREIIKEIVHNNDAEFFYAHAKDPNIFFDIPNMKHAQIQDFMINDQPFILGQNNDVYINTWIGHDNKYVLEGVGCTLEKYVEMFNDTLKKVGLNTLQKKAYEYIPTINYSLLDSKKFVDMLQQPQEKKKILVCNGDAWSGQAINFDFSPIIKRLATEYPDIIFYITSHANCSIMDNVIDIAHWDLNSISYLSTICNVIIGRSSGPHVFSQVRENLEDPSKTFISFTWHVNSTKLSTTFKYQANMIWSPETDEDKVYEVIKRSLN